MNHSPFIDSAARHTTNIAIMGLSALACYLVFNRLLPNGMGAIQILANTVILHGVRLSIEALGDYYDYKGWKKVGVTAVGYGSGLGCAIGANLLVFHNQLFNAAKVAMGAFGRPMYMMSCSMAVAGVLFLILIALIGMGTYVYRSIESKPASSS